MASLFNHLEAEAVLLCAVFDLVNSMVNYEMLRISGSDPNCEVVFTSHAHRRLFNIILVDFLSPTDRKGPIRQRSYLDALISIMSNPHFDVNGSVQLLRSATRRFPTG